MKVAYTNSSLDLGTTDVGSPVLGVKNSGADAVWMPFTSSTVVAIMQTLRQNGGVTKASIGATGCEQDLLDSSAAATFGPNDIVAVLDHTGGAQDDGDDAVPGRPPEVRRYHGCSRLRHVHGATSRPALPSSGCRARARTSPARGSSTRSDPMAATTVRGASACQSV